MAEKARRVVSAKVNNINGARIFGAIKRKLWWRSNKVRHGESTSGGNTGYGSRNGSRGLRILAHRKFLVNSGFMGNVIGIVCEICQIVCHYIWAKV